jgi:hypothetical protein
LMFALPDKKKSRFHLLKTALFILFLDNFILRIILC